VKHSLLVLVTATRIASADTTTDASAKPDAGEDTPTEPAKRKRDATIGRIFRGPFQTSRIYTMPTADTIGAYMLSISGDGSLLQQTGVLTSAGVLAIGFGDIGQLEYRHTSAISVTGINAPVPSAGVQIKLPIPEHSGVPALAVSFRLGRPRTERVADTDVTETVSDLFIVGRLRFDSFKWLTLHGGARISQAKIALSGAETLETAPKVLVLPTGAYELQMNPTAKIVGEIALAPRFSWMPGTGVAPEIGYGLLGRFGMRWSIAPSVILDGSIGYQLDVVTNAPDEGPGAIVQWDIRLGAEVFVPWGALACRATGVFCE
jgi:hypothetical protein